MRWIAINVGTLSRVPAPVHGGVFALKVPAVSTASALVGPGSLVYDDCSLTAG